MIISNIYPIPCHDMTAQRVTHQVQCCCLFALLNLRSFNESGVDPKEYYAEIVVMLWKLAHCPMNVELTEDKEDDDEKVSDRETIESIENLRQFLLVQLHNKRNRKFVVEALSRCWQQVCASI